MKLITGRSCLVLSLLALLAVLGYFLFRSGEAVEARRAVNETAEQVTGLGAVKVGEELKQTLRELKTERREETRRMLGAPAEVDSKEIPPGSEER